MGYGGWDGEWKLISLMISGGCLPAPTNTTTRTSENKNSSAHNDDAQWDKIQEKWDIVVCAESIGLSVSICSTMFHYCFECFIETLNKFQFMSNTLKKEATFIVKTANCLR